MQHAGGSNEQQGGTHSYVCVFAACQLHGSHLRGSLQDEVCSTAHSWLRSGSSRRWRRQQEGTPCKGPKLFQPLHHSP